MGLNNEAQFYKSEYERLRRNKNKQIEQMRVKQSLFFDKTWKLLHLLGLKDEEIIAYYGADNTIENIQRRLS